MPIRYAEGGDLLFKGGSSKSYYQVCPVLGIDHVGLLTHEGTVIHAANCSRGVVEESLARFLKTEKSGSSGLCAGRILP